MSRRRGDAKPGKGYGAHAGRWAEFLQAQHTSEYRAAKAEDFTHFTVRALVITAAFVLFSSLWDHAIDATHAPQVIGLRLLLGAAVLVWALIIRHRAHGWPARLATIAVPLLVEAGFITILARLDGGNAYGIGGFLYFFIFVPFLLLVQSLRLSILVLTAITVFPLIAPLLGISADLDHGIYLAYMLISFPPVVALRLFCEYLYWNLYRYRCQIEQQALTDGMTHLANRRHFLGEGMRLLAHQRRQQRPASLLFIDIDHFKTINDTYGHRIGDIAIDHLAEQLRRQAREGDLIARYGGEEFLVLLPDTAPVQAERIAERIRQGVAATPLFVPDGGVPALDLTISIGVAGYDPRSEVPPDIDVLIHDADQAVYAAKRRGRNRVARA
ncbi:GGDEF domain-containing protein [Modicisalibacter coralii]|uniref:GGDEF domain-containing protein n=1 Tax=Modicisalibacter coralii TaxID=2304602 RepID=UPI00139689A1|nr:GGDEF domain-containing protein [Halomonas coralii]